MWLAWVYLALVSGLAHTRIHGMPLVNHSRRQCFATTDVDRVVNTQVVQRSIMHKQPSRFTTDRQGEQVTSPLLDRFYYGGDWNPEQFDEQVWSSDVEKLEHAGINTATIHVF